MQRFATAEWQGQLNGGKGFISTESHALTHTPYSFATRFENDQTGTNPEELIAAAHAGCFSMALSHELAQKGFNVELIRTQASVKLVKTAEGFKISNVHLVVRANIPNSDYEEFRIAAESAKKNCPVSKLLGTEITMDANLEASQTDKVTQANH